jgi:hypothetical protein
LKKNHQQSRAHHYVPQWYQRQFLPPGGPQFFYLDLNPDTVIRDGVSHVRDALLRWSPKKCFYRDELYTVKLGNWTTDQLERSFFGEVDVRGREAVMHFAEFDRIEKPTWGAGQNLPQYMDAQKFRTPKGLDLIKSKIGTLDHNATLQVMSNQFEYSTMWMEGIWEIVRSRRSATKFIVTDEPVTFYCKSVFSSEWKYPNEMSLKQVGTRTIFPLSLDSCLIVTHLEFIRNPWTTPTLFRTNARSYQSAIKHLGDIQFGRELEEDEVLRINYIMKRRATRYIAAAEEEWLYPERRVSTTDWSKLDDDWFLLPHLWRVPFSTQIIVGHNNGRSSAWDEYGRRPWQRDYQNERQREREHQSFDMAKREWAKKRLGKSRARADERIGRDVADKIMDDYLRRERLLSEGHTVAHKSVERDEDINSD